MIVVLDEARAHCDLALFGPIAPTWQLIAVLAHGRLLAPLRSG